MSEPSDRDSSDVAGEYRAIRERAAVVSGLRAATWVTGPDAVTFLDGLLSQDIGALGVASVGRSLLLEPRGKLRAMLWLLRGDDRVGILCDAGRRDDVVADLRRYRFRVAAEIRPVSEPVVELWGPGSAAVLSSAGLGVPDGWATAGGTTVAAIPLRGLPRYAVVGGDLEALVAAGGVAVGPLAVDAVRIEGGEPVAGIDVDETTIPQEAGVVGETVSFTKGCYLGQELVARIDARGHVNRLLRGVAIGGRVLPPTGATVRGGGGDAGVLTSVAESPETRTSVALAMLRREVEPGTRVAISWDGGSAEGVVRELPFDDFADALQTSNTPP